MKCLLLVCFIGFASSQIIKDGKCPDMHVMTNLEKDRLLGTWYLIKHIENDYEKDWICTTSHMDAWTNNVLTGHTHATNKTTNEKDEITYNATFTTDDINVAKLTTHYKFKGETESDDVQIIDTDYDNYLISWECFEEDGKTETYMWIDSRKRKMASDMLDKVMEIMKKYNIDTTMLKDVEQDKC